MFLCSPDTKLLCAEPGPAENPCSLVAETVQKLSSGRARACLPGRVASPVTSSPLWGWSGRRGSSEKVFVCVCTARLRAMLPSGRGDGAESHLGRLACGDGKGWLVGFPVPVLGRVLSLWSRFTHCVPAMRLSQGRGCASSAVPEVGGRQWEWVRPGCCILAVPKESSLHTLELWLKIKLAPVKI